MASNLTGKISQVLGAVVDIEFEGELSLVPQNLIQLSANEADKVVKLLELIENHDDVQKVHTNFEII